MGWTVDELCDRDHEGYVQAVELRHDSTHQWRDVNLTDDEWRARAAKGVAVHHVQVCCTCGWRSERFHAPGGTDWVPAITCFPSYMGDGGYYDEACGEVWFHEHARPMVDEPKLASRSLLGVARQYGLKPAMTSLLGE